MTDQPPPSYQEAFSQSCAQDSKKTSPPKPVLGPGEKHLLKIYHAPSGNSLITAADEKTPIYNVIDSRAPPPSENATLNGQRVYSAAELQEMQTRGNAPAAQRTAGMSRQDPHNPQHSNQDYKMSHGSAQNQTLGQAHGQQNPSGMRNPYAPPRTVQELWTLTVRKGHDRNGPILAEIRRHISTRSAVSITMADGYKTGITQHSGIGHTKYFFQWHGRSFVWKYTHSAPDTSKLDSGNFKCHLEGDSKAIFAWSESEDKRCDGSLLYEPRALEEDLLDIMTITGFIVRDLYDERQNPSFMYGPGYGYGGPYGSAYGYGYPIMGAPLFLPFLLV